MVHTNTKKRFTEDTWSLRNKMSNYTFDSEIAQSRTWKPNKPTIVPIQSYLSAEVYQKEYVPQDKKRLRHGKPCVICGLRPTQIAIFDMDGAQVIERYCDTCVENVY